MPRTPKTSRARTALAALGAATLGVGTFLAVQTVVAEPRVDGTTGTMEQAAATDPDFAAALAAARKLVGQDAPAFELQSADGETVTLAGAKGKVVLLDFWATWCPPCRAAMPNLQRLHDEKPAEAFQLYAVNMQEPKAAVDKYMAQQKFTMPALLDADGAVRDRYGVVAFPTTFIVGKDGKVADAIVGPFEAEVNAAVDKALAVAD